MDLSYQDSSDEDSNIFINNSLKPINNWNFLFQMKTELNLPAYFWGKLVTVKNLTAICRAKTYKGKNLPDLKWPVLSRPIWKAKMKDRKQEMAISRLFGLKMKK